MRDRGVFIIRSLHELSWASPPQAGANSCIRGRSARQQSIIKQWVRGKVGISGYGDVIVPVMVRFMGAGIC